MATTRPVGHPVGVPLNDDHRASIAEGVRAQRAAERERLADVEARLQVALDRLETYAMAEAEEAS